MIGGGVLLWPRPPADPVVAAGLPADELEHAQERWVIVYVRGAVARPGLYRLPATDRVVDALVSAGGVRADADPACLPNLAARLKDGRDIAVPALGQCRGARRVKLDINVATRDQLLAVPGIDASLADAIISYREQGGGFERLSELKSGLGIDAILYRQLQRSLTVP